MISLWGLKCLYIHWALLNDILEKFNSELIHGSFINMHPDDFYVKLVFTSIFYLVQDILVQGIFP